MAEPTVSKIGLLCSYVERAGSSIVTSNNVAEAARAALMMSLSGIASNVATPTSTVRQSDSPQTEQQRLLPALAPSHSSMGLPAIQMRLDSEGSVLNESWSITRVSSVGSIPKGRSASLSLLTARCIS